MRDLPASYQPNPDDDRRAVEAGLGEAYRALASAIEECDAAYAEVLEKAKAGEHLALKACSATKSGQRALRRAAWIVAAVSNYPSPR